MQAQHQEAVLYKIVLIYFRNNDCVDYAPAFDLMEHWRSDAWRAAVGEEDAR
jgi:hypothetical protein